MPYCVVIASRTPASRACVYRTPFAGPVEPEVNSTAARSSIAGGRGQRAARGPSRGELRQRVPHAERRPRDGGQPGRRDPDARPAERARRGERGRDADDPVGPRALDRAGQPLHAEARVGDDDDGADAEAGVQRGGEVGAGRHEQRDAVAAADADRVEAGGDLADAPGEQPPGHRAACRRRAARRAPERRRPRAPPPPPTAARSRRRARRPGSRCRAPGSVRRPSRAPRRRRPRPRAAGGRRPRSGARPRAASGASGRAGSAPGTPDRAGPRAAARARRARRGRPRCRRPPRGSGARRSTGCPRRSPGCPPAARAERYGLRNAARTAPVEARVRDRRASCRGTRWCARCRARTAASAAFSAAGSAACPSTAVFVSTRPASTSRVRERPAGDDDAAPVVPERDDAVRRGRARPSARRGPARGRRRAGRRRCARTSPSRAGRPRRRARPAPPRGRAAMDSAASRRQR